MRFHPDRARFERPRRAKSGKPIGTQFGHGIPDRDRQQARAAEGKPGDVELELERHEKNGDGQDGKKHGARQPADFENSGNAGLGFGVVIPALGIQPGQKGEQRNDRHVEYREK